MGTSIMTQRTRLSATCSSLFRIAALGTSVLLLSSCAYWPGAGNNGLLYTDVTMPVAVLDQEAANVRTGKACSTGILGLYASGNSSISAAKAKAGITKISTVEKYYSQVLLGAYSQYCTVVSGT